MNARATPSADTWLLLRGLTRETGHWGDLPDRLAAALPGARVIALDLPGNGVLHGEPSPASVEAMVEALRAQWAGLATLIAGAEAGTMPDLAAAPRAAGTTGHDPAGLPELHGSPDARPAAAPRVNLLAMSLGAMVAVAWAAAHPAEIGRAVLVNTSLRPFSPPWQRLRPRNWLRLPGLLRPWLSASEVEEGVLRLTSARVHVRAAAGNPSELPAAYAPDADPAANYLPPWTAAERRLIVGCWVELRARHPVTGANALRQLGAAMRYRAPAEAPPVPLLLLAGGRDALVSPQCSRRLAAVWGLPLREHARAGHDLPLDAPDWVVAQVAAFAAGAAASGPASAPGSAVSAPGPTARAAASPADDARPAGQSPVPGPAGFRHRA
ncbi:alpha/beta fold hydrolase [Derxia gummosa]|uniref:Alpha/beta fold hydrolase n=1 Tax=Derxia gummosa DSM 723 TaxID=1121388 RepID=A0A8B6X9M3_9BURK|nr:alpha/beta hydrolase [Derxia gummosa]